MKLMELMRKAAEVYKEYNPDGNYLSIGIVGGNINIANSFFADDKEKPLNIWMPADEEIPELAEEEEEPVEETDEAIDFVAEIAGKWAEYRTEKARKGEDLNHFDKLMKLQITVGAAGTDLADDIYEAAIEISDIQIKAYEFSIQRKDALNEGIPMLDYDRQMYKLIFFGNLDEEKTEKIFRLAIELSERKGFRW